MARTAGGELPRRPSEERYRQLFERLAAGVYTTAWDGRILEWSPAMTRIFGYSAADMRSLTTYDLYFDRGERATLLERLERDGFVDCLEMRFRHKDGHAIWTLFSAALVRDAAGRPLLLEGSIIDITQRKQAEEALRESEARNRALLDGAPEPIFVHRADRIVFANPALLRFLRVQRPEQVLGHSPFEFIHPDFHLSARRAMDELHRGGPMVLMDRKYVCPDGSVVVAEITASALHFEGQPAIVVQLTDITARQHTEAALKSSEEQYYNLVDGLPVGVYHTDAAGRWVSVNQRMLRMFGWADLDAARATQPPALYPCQEDRQRWEERLHRQGEVREFEAEMRRPDGKPLWVRHSARLVRSPAGAILGTEGMLEDITERKLAAEKVQAVTERLHLLLDSTAEGIYGVDLDGNCTFCNRASAQLLGYKDANELLGRNIHALIHHSRRDGTPHPAEECPVGLTGRLDRDVYESDDVFWRADGSSCPVEFWSYPVRRDGQVIGAVVTFFDITQRRQLEQEYRQAQKMEAVGRLAGGVAHDFNNMLTVILGRAEQVHGKLAPDSPLQTAMTSIIQAGERAAKLTQQLLAYSRKQVLQPRLLNLNDLIAEMGELLRRLLGEDVELILKPGPDLGFVKADPGQMEQVLVNMAVNARDAMPEGGRLVIASARQQTEAGDFVALTVSDTGAGMSAEVQLRIFEPFFTTKEQGKGTGLGLAMVLGVVEQSGGRIKLDSHPGQGTTFTILLPRVSERPAAPRRSAPPAALEAGQETVLLVEDEAPLREFVRDVLEAAGYHVLDAGDGYEALALVEGQSGPIDLLLTDVVMPGIAGRELADRVLALRPELKVVYMSGYNDDALVQHGVSRQAVAYIHKPFSPPELTQKLRQCLNATAARAG